MPKQRLVRIERRKQISIQEFKEIYAALENRLAADLIAPQIPTSMLSKKVSGNVITPDSAPVPDCLTCGVCCNFAPGVPVAPEDITSPKNYWDITTQGTSAPIVIDRFLRLNTETGNCAAVAEARAKLQQAPATKKITSVAIVPQEVQSQHMLMTRSPDGGFSCVTEEITEVVCKVYVLLDDTTQVEIYSYNPSEESWLQHEFLNLTLDEAQNLISERKTSAGQDA
jgi:hypothetical protein